MRRMTLFLRRKGENDAQGGLLLRWEDGVYLRVYLGVYIEWYPWGIPPYMPPYVPLLVDTSLCTP